MSLLVLDFCCLYCMSHADVCRHHTLLFIMCGSILSPNHNLSSPEGRKQVCFYLCSPAAPSRVAYGGKWHIRKIIITSIDACLQKTNCCPKYLTGISSFDPDNKPTEVGEGLAQGQKHRWRWQWRQQRNGKYRVPGGAEQVVAERGLRSRTWTEVLAPSLPSRETLAR